MVVELRADEHLIQRKTLQLCHRPGGRASDRSPQTMMTFTIQGGRTFQDEYHTTRADIIRTDVWEADADTDAVILGVSFMGKRQILLNTLHVLMPGKARMDTVDRGLTITSFPASSREPHNVSLHQTGELR